MLIFVFSFLSTAADSGGLVAPEAFGLEEAEVEAPLFPALGAPSLNICTLSWAGLTANKVDT